MNFLALMQHAPSNRGDMDDDIVDALRNPPVIEEAEKQEFAGMIATLMERATSNKVRNAAAILLTDLIGRHATESIVGVLRCPGMAQSAGSLLFALNDIEAKLPLDLAIDVIEHGSLEAQGEALTFMQDARIEPFTAEECDDARRRLGALQEESSNPKTNDAVGFALDYLKDLAPEPVQSRRA